MSKFISRAAAVALVLSVAAPAVAEDRLSVTATLTGVSEYYFRGISQSYGNSDIKPAIQPGVEGAFKITSDLTGYIGMWGSNVDFNNGTSAETNFLGGFRYTLDKLTLDLGTIRYSYLDTDEAPAQDFTEYKLLGAYDFGFAIPSAGAYYTNEFFGQAGEATYLTAGVAIPIPVTEFSPKIVANVGRQAIETNTDFGTKDYIDWNVGLYATFFGVTAGIQYVDNNLKKADAVNTVCRSVGDPCSAAAIFSLSYAYTF